MVTTTNDAVSDKGTRRTSLTVRISLLLTLALLPLAVLAILQGVAAVETARETYRQSLTAQTVRAARPEADTILRISGMVQGLAGTVPDIVDDPARCSSVMERVARDYPRITFVGFVDRDQTTACNNVGRSFDFSDNPESRALFAAPRSDITFNAAGSASGQAVVIVSEPVLADDGTFLGFVSLSFPSRPLEEASAALLVDDALTLITFSADGKILTTVGDRAAVAPLLPAEGLLSEFVNSGQRVFSARSADGLLRSYAVAPILAGEAFTLGIWERSELRVADYPSILVAAGFPLLMWMASLVVAVLALRHQVIRPVRLLRMRMRGFADGRAVFRATSVNDAPRELHEIGITFEQLANQIVRDEADLENKVREREVLLREVHHRVKNNLQLMSSIINMQVRQNVTEDVEAALRRVQERLASLARFHQDLYASSSLSELSADQLLEDLARQTISLNTDPRRPFDLRLDLEKVVLEPDVAGPLAMLITEALANALHHGDSDGSAPLYVALRMTRTCTQEGIKIVVTVENPVSRDTPAQEPGLGQRLILAFATQMNGDLTQERLQDRYIVKVEFTPKP